MRPDPGTFRFDGAVTKVTYIDSDGASATPEADLQSEMLEVLDKLVRPLMDLPVTYTLASLPTLEDAQADRQADPPLRGILVYRHVARVHSAGQEEEERTLALALNFGGPGGAASELGAVEFTGDQSNVALVISSAGMNQLLEQLLPQQEDPEQEDPEQEDPEQEDPEQEDPGEDPATWRAVTVRFAEGAALLRGQWARGDETPLTVEARLACQIDETGWLEVGTRSADAIQVNDAICAEQALAAAIVRSWRLLLERLLRVTLDPSGDGAGGERHPTHRRGDRRQVE
jgi:hypothetical protein